MAEPPPSEWNPNNLSASLGFTRLQYNRTYEEAPRSRAEGSHGQHYAGKFGFLYVYATTKNNGRGAMGRYTEWIHHQRQENQSMAEQYQRYVVKNMRAGIRRPKVSTGRLLRVTGSTGNIGHSDDWWGVGNAMYLDRSQAKYWRTIEEGSARAWKRSFIGDPLVGVFGETMLDGRRAGPPFTRAGANRAGKFRPYPRAIRYDIVASGAKIARVKQHIKPMNAYRNAWKQMGGGREMAYVMTSRIPGVMGHAGRPDLSR